MRRDCLFRLVGDLIEAELAAGRPGQSLDPDRAAWTEGLRIRDGALAQDEQAGNGNLGLDSLDLILTATRVSEFFHLADWATAENLIRFKTLGAWVDVVEQTIHRKDGTEEWSRLTFQTSGSTGQAKRVTHTREALEGEVTFLAELLGPVERIVSLVPAHHLYGFLWTLLLPDRLGIPVLDARFLAPGVLRAALRPGDLIVAFPLRWQLLFRLLGEFPAGIQGVSSAGPMTDALWRDAAACGMHRLFDIYGSTETGGAGWRTGPGPYRVFANQPAEWTAKTMDELRWTGPDDFFVERRRDGAIKVAGHLVDLSAVERELQQHPAIGSCRVRLDAATGRLRALAVPESGGEPPPAAEILQWLAGRVLPAALPRTLDWGERLPVNALGKAADWKA
jgi:long-chain acyl-CoA synthetase